MSNRLRKKRKKEREKGKYRIEIIGSFMCLRIVLTMNIERSKRLMRGTLSNDNPISTLLHVRLSTND